MPPWVAKEKIGTLLLASETPVPIPRSRTVLYVSYHILVWRHSAHSVSAQYQAQCLLVRVPHRHLIQRMERPNPPGGPEPQPPDPKPTTADPRPQTPDSQLPTTTPKPQIPTTPSVGNDWQRLACYWPRRRQGQNRGFG